MEDIHDMVLLMEELGYRTTYEEMKEYIGTRCQDSFLIDFKV
jgi:hypothetical protein